MPWLLTVAVILLAGTDTVVVVKLWRDPSPRPLGRTYYWGWWWGALPATCASVWGMAVFALADANVGTSGLVGGLVMVVVGLLFLGGFVVACAVQLFGRPAWAIPPGLREVRRTWHDHRHWP